MQVTTSIFLIAFSTLAVIHTLAVKLCLYFYFWWLDIPVHAFGGVIVALGFFTLADLRLFKSSWLSLWRIVFLVFLIAVMWEIFEVLIGIPRDAYYVSDTALDITMGTLGSFLGFFIGKQLKNI